MAARFPMSPRIGYGNTVTAKARTLRCWPTASAQGAISSPAWAPTMVAPRMRPPGVVTTLMWPAGSRSICARSFSCNGQRNSPKPREQPEAAAGGRGGGSGRATRGELGVGEGHAGGQVRIRARNLPEHRRARGERGVVARHMLKAAGARRIADRIHRPVRSAQMGVDGDPVRAVLDARRLEREAVDVRPPRGRDEEVAPLDRLLAAVG